MSIKLQKSGQLGYRSISFHAKLILCNNQAPDYGYLSVTTNRNHCLSMRLLCICMIQMSTFFIFSIFLTEETLILLLYAISVIILFLTKIMFRKWHSNTSGLFANPSILINQSITNKVQISSLFPTFYSRSAHQDVSIKFFRKILFLTFITYK